MVRGAFFFSLFSSISVQEKVQPVTKIFSIYVLGNPSGVYNISAQAPATMPLMFNSSIANGVGNSFPQPINSNLSSKVI